MSLINPNSISEAAHRLVKVLICHRLMPRKLRQEKVTKSCSFVLFFYLNKGGKPCRRRQNEDLFEWPCWSIWWQCRAPFAERNSCPPWSMTRALLGCPLPVDEQESSAQRAVGEKYGKQISETRHEKLGGFLQEFRRGFQIPCASAIEESNSTPAPSSDTGQAHGLPWKSFPPAKVKSLWKRKK